MSFAYLIEPPFNYVDATGRVTGTDVELARHVFSTLGLSDFDPVETEFAALLPGLADGRWRMTTGMLITDERRAHARFSRPIWALSDGLLVAKGNPLRLTGYRSLAKAPTAKLAVIRDQFQHPTALRFGLPDDRITVFETYTAAAQAVQTGKVDAYASIARAHDGFVQQNAHLDLEVIHVPHTETPPAFGAFALGLQDETFAKDVDTALAEFLGTQAHRHMLAPFGFSSAEVDLICT